MVLASMLSESSINPMLESRAAQYVCRAMIHNDYNEMCRNEAESKGNPIREIAVIELVVLGEA